MSLIEKASKRLEELRRAGAELPGDEPAATAAAPPVGMPTPEAVVRALSSAPAAASDVAAEAGAVRAALHLDAVADRDKGARVVARPPGRRVEIDLTRLDKLGYIVPDKSNSQIADEFRVVKRPILRNALVPRSNKAAPNSRNLVMVTSALPGEGKTFTAVNLAMSIATELNHTVLLVDGDVAHPTLPQLLGIPSEPGLLELLTRDDIDVGDALVRTNVDKLTILPAGSRQRRATELLASEQMANLLRELSSRYPDRMIIFDSPPLLPTTEARVLATHMGQIVMVVAADATSQNAVTHALSTIESCEIVLTLLNKATHSEVGSYYGYYADDAATA